MILEPYRTTLEASKTMTPKAHCLDLRAYQSPKAICIIVFIIFIIVIISLIIVIVLITLYIIDV